MAPPVRITVETRMAPSQKTATSADALAKKTVPAVLGEVTCFLSHSWRDDGARRPPRGVHAASAAAS